MTNRKIKVSIIGNTVILDGNVEKIIVNGITIDLSPNSGDGGIRISKHPRKNPRMPSPLESITIPRRINPTPVAKQESRHQLRYSKKVQLKKEMRK